MKLFNSSWKQTVLAAWLALGCGLWLSLGPEAAAISADPRPFEHTQPDGTRVTLRLRGDEFFHWHEDLQGFTVVRVGSRFEYARLNAQNALEATGTQAGRTDPRTLGLTPRLLPPREARPLNENRALTPYRPWLQDDKGVGEKIAASGTVRNLVILCKFSDHTNGVHTRPREDYDVLFNQAGTNAIVPTGSVRGAYLENSYGIVTLQSVVVAWVNLPQTEAYYAGVDNGRGTYPFNSRRMVQDALALVDPLVDIGTFDRNRDGFIDAITFIHSGYGAEQTGMSNQIWSHKWNLNTPWISADQNALGVNVKVQDFFTVPALWGGTSNEIVRIGVICHELGHFFGLPDLYDTDDSPGQGIGSWCMMAGSWGFDGSQWRPPHFSAWCKSFLGWVTPVPLVVPGNYSMIQAETTPGAYRITAGFPPGEYLLIENRQPVGLDANIPQGGLAIWHVDETVGTNSNEGFPGQPGWPGNGRHYKIALLQADGAYDLERGTNGGDAGDLFRLGGVNQINTGTIPNTDSYQFGIVHPTFNAIANVSVSGSTMSFFYNYFAPEFWLDRNLLCTAPETGASTCTPLFFRPYITYASGTAGTPAGGTLRIRPANYPATNVTVNKYLKLKAEGGSVSIGKP